MAYLIFSTDGLEWDRRELSGPMLLGRSTECEISIHDILLSRRHCRFTPVNGGWQVMDLSSRNGTVIADRKIEKSMLESGDVIRIGKVQITFRAEPFVSGSTKSKRPLVPPAIGRMEETLAGTVVEMEVEIKPPPVRPPMILGKAVPKPRPRDPDSFDTDDLYSMLEQIASSSWDSIYSVNAQPLRRNRAMPRPIIAGQPRPRPARPPVSMALQASIVDRPVIQVKSAPKVRQRFPRLGRWISRLRTLTLF